MRFQYLRNSSLHPVIPYRSLSFPRFLQIVALALEPVAGLIGDLRMMGTELEDLVGPLTDL